MQELQTRALELMKDQHFNCLAVAIIDFKNASYNSFEIEEGELRAVPQYFDLASLTKPLTLAATYLYHPNLFSANDILLLEHRAGLPAWARLDANWRAHVESFAIKEAPTKYSDLSALRLMCELEKKSGKSLKELCSSYWDKDLFYHLDHPNPLLSPCTGQRRKEEIRGVVHDDNAFIINEFCSHAGLFATIDGLAKSLITLNKETSFVQKIMTLFPEKKERFLRGWDTVDNPEETLAGRGCSAYTFGHLGFTGTSVWVDGEKQKAAIILSNATLNYWYERAGLRKLRRELGQLFWEN